MDKKNLSNETLEDKQLDELLGLKDKLQEKLSNSSLDVSQINDIIKLIESNDNNSSKLSFEDYAKWKKILKQTDNWHNVIYEVEDDWQLYYCIQIKDAQKILDLQFSPDNHYSAPAFRAVNYYAKVFYVDSQWLSVFKNIVMDINSDNRSWQYYQLKVFPGSEQKILNKVSLSSYLQWKKIIETHKFWTIDVYVLQDGDKKIWCFVLNGAIIITWADRIKHHLLTWFRSVYSIESIDENWIKSIATIQATPIKETDELVFFTTP